MMEDSEFISQSCDGGNPSFDPDEVDRPPCLDCSEKVNDEQKTHTLQSCNLNKVSEQSFLVIDGKAEVDDMLITACFANYEQAALKRIREASLQAESCTISHDEKRKRDLKDLLSQHGFEECLTSQDSCASSGSRALSENNVDLNEGCGSSCSEEDNPKIIETLKPNDPSEKILNQKKKQSATKSTSKDQTSTAEPFWSFQPVTLENLPRVISEGVELIHIGHVRSKLNETVIVQSTHEKRALDLGSVLCTQSRVVIGTISDTFGPVNSPLYVVCNCKANVAVDEKIFADGNNFSFVIENQNNVPEYLKRAFETEVGDTGIMENSSESDGDIQDFGPVSQMNDIYKEPAPSLSVKQRMPERRFLMRPSQHPTATNPPPAHYPLFNRPYFQLPYSGVDPYGFRGPEYLTSKNRCSPTYDFLKAQATSTSANKPNAYAHRFAPWQSRTPYSQPLHYIKPRANLTNQENISYGNHPTNPCFYPHQEFSAPSHQSQYYQGNLNP